MDSLAETLHLLTAPVVGGVIPLKALLGLVIFYGAIRLAGRARDWFDRLDTERDIAEHRRLRRWVYRSTLAFGSVVAFGVAGVPVRAILGQRLTTLGETELTLMTLITAAAAVLVGWWFSQLLQEAVKGSFSRRGVAEEGTVHAVNRLVHYAVMGMVLGVALQTVGVNLGALFAAGAVFAVGIGFALQHVVENFVSGLILLVERTIKTRDVLEIEGRVVAVQSIGLRSTVVRSWDDEDLIVPNSTLVQTTVKNFTLRDHLIRVRATVGVHYDSDMDQVAEVLEAAAGTVPGQATGRDPVIFLTQFADSAVTWEVSIWTRRPWEVPATRSQLNRAIWRALKHADITIAYPQLDVHVVREETQ